MTSQKIRQYLTLTCKIPIPKLLIIIKLSIQILKIWQSYSPVLLIFSIGVPNLMTIGRHSTSFLTCATFNMKFIQDTNRVAINSLKKVVFHRSEVNVTGQGHRDGTLLFEGTVISQKLSHKQFSIFCL